jgi:hypothetical protein
VYHKWWNGLQAVGKCAVYGAKQSNRGVNAPYPDGLKAIPPTYETPTSEQVRRYHSIFERVRIFFIELKTCSKLDPVS